VTDKGGVKAIVASDADKKQIPKPVADALATLSKKGLSVNVDSLKQLDQTDRRKLFSCLATSLQKQEDQP
jgi:lambda repressor-like predicted transcriptional regulator